jgi:hypothetical protein
MTTWKKSSRSAYNGNCVEVSSQNGSEILVRDSKHPSGSILNFPQLDWEAFVGGVRNGKFDHQPRNQQL